MKQVSVCSPNLALIPDHGLNIETLQLHGNDLYVSLIETDDPAFDAQGPLSKECVLVRKSGFSLNFRDKTDILLVNHLSRKNPNSYYYLPVGSDFAGVVEAIGSEVKTLKPGDRVIGNASFPFREYAHVTPGIPTVMASKEYEQFHHSRLVKIPDCLDDVSAAAFTVNSQTAFSMIRRMEARKDDKVLVTAATSNTSLFIINALKSSGLKVSALTSTPGAKGKLEQLGVNEVIVVDRSTPDLSTNSQIESIIKDFGKFDCVFDPMSDIYLPEVVKIMAPFAKYITCGYHNQYSALVKEAVHNAPAISTQTLGKIISNNLTIIGNCLGQTADLVNAIQKFEAHEYNITIDRWFTGSDVAPFFDRTYNSKDRFGKVVYKY